MSYGSDHRTWRANGLLTAWRAGRPTLNGWLTIPDGVSAEVMAHAGWDSVTLDLQHGLIDYQRAVTMLQATAAAPAIPLARVPSHDPGLIGKLLDAGAYGVICPLVDTADQARAFVAACRYPPHGCRSFGPVRASLSIGRDYATRADGEVLALAMIETRGGLDAVEAICDVPGLSGIYIGPADLSLALGVAPGFDSEDARVVEAITHVIRTARSRGRWVGVHNATVAYAERMIGLGANLVTVGSDLRLLAAHAAQVVNEFRGNRAAP